MKNREREKRKVREEEERNGEPQATANQPLPLEAISKQCIVIMLKPTV